MASALHASAVATQQRRSSPVSRTRLPCVAAVSFRPSALPRRYRAKACRSNRLVCTVVVADASAAKAAPLKVMIAGAPGCGKGTQCAKIVEQFNLVHISVGDILRAEVKAGTPAGLKAKSFMDSGNLVPDEVVVTMVKNRLAENDVLENGWLLDGYPRSASQAEAIEKEGIRPDVFLLINVPDEVIIDRVVGRRLDPVTGEIYHMTHKPPPEDETIRSRLQQRSDDTEEKARNRLNVYHDNVDAVIGYYRDTVVEINGHVAMDEVFTQIQDALHKRLPTAV